MAAKQRRKHKAVNTAARRRQKATKAKTKRPKGRATNLPADNTAVAKAQRTLDKIAKKTKLTQKEIAFVWVALGGPITGPYGADVASAVAMAESGGDTKICNPCCCGLWQMNVLSGDGNPCSDTMKTKEDAGNVIKATRCTIRTVKGGPSDGGAWSPWEAYTNGMYKQYTGNISQTTMVGIFDDAWDAVTQGGILDSDSPAGQGADAVTGAAGDAAGAVSDVATGVADLVNSLFEPAFLMRIGKVVVGVILLVVGLSALSKALTGISATDVIPAAKIGKLAKSGIGKKG